MTLVKFNQPGAKTLNGFLDGFLNDFSHAPNNNLTFPPVNITEGNDDYSLAFNVPGRNKEDFKITVDKNILTVSFDKKEETRDESKKQIKKEFSFQSFKRSFTLDEKIAAENIAAKYENGILTLALPKKEEVKVQPKEIAIS
ncbi:MAG: Hsp20/alpha crystallin family protein [Ginsengibacter sp.]